MTKGIIYLIDERSGGYKSATFRSDMYLTLPNGHGAEIIEAFLHREIETDNDLAKFTKDTFHKWFGVEFEGLDDPDCPDEETDDDIYYDEYGKEIVRGLGKISELNIGGSYIDYSYIMNLSENEISVKLKDNTVSVGRAEMLVINYDSVLGKIKRSDGDIKVILSDDETKLITDALDFYNRIFIGQYDRIESIITGWNLNGCNPPQRDAYTRKNLLEAIRSRMFRDTDIARVGLSGSLGIWNPLTDIRAKDGYGIQQVMRYKRALVQNPGDTWSVDHDEPIIKGSLPEIGCEYLKNGESGTETIKVNTGHLKIINDALMVYERLYDLKIRKLFEYFTDDAVCFDIASILDRMYAGTQRDKKTSDLILALRKKMILAGAEGVDDGIAL